ncbi:hypothetical protein [Streptomyces sp. NBC_01260]|uniref:hypothetical protein n=1 Tax=Streptomyces sp. NBC_01260 TaxID=2903801 RepID=UPI003FCDB7A6
MSSLPAAAACRRGAGAISLASALPTRSPSVVVLDEMPYLVREDPSFEGTLQKAFDRTLSKLPVLLIRTNDPEIDIVGADRAPIAKKITLVGSVKCLEKEPFDNRDLARLVTHRSQLPGADDTTPLLAVTRSGCTADVSTLTPQDLHDAWT